jgi:hypothetical protein
MAIVFSAGGTRWNLEVIDTNGSTSTAVHSTLAGRTGLLVRSSDGETRFLHMESAKLPSQEQLAAMSNQDLGTWAFQGAEIRDVA